jgi:hypothetical protein
MPKVIFDGHIAQTRAIEPAADDLFAFRDAVKSLALEAIKHYTWEGPFYPETQRAFVGLCEKFGVDYTYKKDRVAFATALLEFI